jgi:hypothetical protein
MKKYINTFYNKNENFYNLLYQKTFDLTVEWGDSWNELINARIKKLHPAIPDEEIKRLRRESENILKHSEGLFEKERLGKISRSEFIEGIKKNYPRLSQQNIDKLVNEKLTKQRGAQKGRNVNGNIFGIISFYQKTRSTINMIRPWKTK